MSKTEVRLPRFKACKPFSIIAAIILNDECHPYPFISIFFPQVLSIKLQFTKMIKFVNGTVWETLSVRGNIYEERYFM